MENQAAQVLREANTLGSGNGGSNIDGFTNIAFQIVRRVFGGLVANELVSIQPMSLPSGLLFYLDYTYGSDVGGDATVDNAGNLTDTVASTYTRGQSIYGNPDGRDIRTGADAAGGQYDLVGTAYSKVHATGVKYVIDAAGDAHMGAFGTSASQSYTDNAVVGTSGADAKLLQFDPQILTQIDNGDFTYQFMVLSASLLQEASGQQRRIDATQIKTLAVHDGGNSSVTARFSNGLTVPNTAVQGGTGVFNVRRLNQLGSMSGINGTFKFTPDPLKDITDADAGVLLVMQGRNQESVQADTADSLCLTASFVVADTVQNRTSGGEGTTLVIPSFESDFNSVPEPVIPEIDIKIESIAVTATTRKLRARWSPELAQDLNAYHSMDAEVELTQILSEQIALEIDREILNDLLVEAKGANFFWSRSPGKFLNKRTGAEIARTSSLNPGPAFTGTVREWYETLVETIIDVANEIHRKTLRGSANFIVVSPEVATIFEASVLYKPSIKIDGQGQAAISNIGAEAIGSLSNRFTVYKDPYFPRNKILVGYKGGSYLESGYVYAPYVPLIVTPTIFAPEDFTPRKGVMTRYGKKMVRADFYGTVTCLDMDVI